MHLGVGGGAADAVVEGERQRETRRRDGQSCVGAVGDGFAF